MALRRVTIVLFVASVFQVRHGHHRFDRSHAYAFRAFVFRGLFLDVLLAVGVGCEQQWFTERSLRKMFPRPIIITSAYCTKGRVAGGNFPKARPSTARSKNRLGFRYSVDDLRTIFVRELGQRSERRHR